MSSRKRIIVLTSWSMKEGLIQSYTLPYLKIISQLQDHTIYLVTLEKEAFQCSKEEKTTLLQSLADQNIHWIPKKYVPFGLQAFVRMFFTLIGLFFLTKRKKIDVVHAICTPSGMLGYILSKLTGAKLIIDSFEPHSDMMLQSNTWSKKGLAYKTLFSFEKKQAKHAHVWIAANRDMKDYALKHYHAEPRSYQWKPACVNIDQFLVSKSKTKQLRSELGFLDDDIVCVCASKIGGMYLEEEIVDFFKAAQDYWKGRFKVLLLNNYPKEKLVDLCHSANVNPSIIVQRLVPYEDIPLYLSVGDFAFSPLKPIPANRYTTPIKNGEYWAASLPTVIPKNISEDSDIIKKEKIGAVLKDLSFPSYQIAIGEIDQLLQEKNNQQLSSKIKEVAKKYRDFSIAQHVYQEVYGS